MVLISACLCGCNCKYNGKNNLNEKCLKILKEKKGIPVCPEQLGGLKTPRVPSEIKEEKVITKDLEDVTKNFVNGAKEALKLAKLVDCKIAILKDGSPSCGSNYIYDGSFTGNKVEGRGITAKLLEENGIKVISENELDVNFV